MVVKSRKKTFTSKVGELSWLNTIFQMIDDNVQTLNTSKVFAGIMVMVINIAGKFVQFRFSKSIENYLKFTFSRDVLIFCMIWMGSRDIYIALVVTIIFHIFSEQLFHEESPYCVLPESFTQQYENMGPTEDEIRKAKEILSQADKNRISQ
jgi:hypothetical protein